MGLGDLESLVALVVLDVRDGRLGVGGEIWHHVAGRFPGQAVDVGGLADPLGLLDLLGLSGLEEALASDPVACCHAGGHLWGVGPEDLDHLVDVETCFVVLGVVRRGHPEALGLDGRLGRDQMRSWDHTCPAAWWDDLAVEVAERSREARPEADRDPRMARSFSGLDLYRVGRCKDQQGGNPLPFHVVVHLAQGRRKHPGTNYRVAYKRLDRSHSLHIAGPWAAEGFPSSQRSAVQTGAVSRDLQNLAFLHDNDDLGSGDHAHPKTDRTFRA